MKTMLAAFLPGNGSVDLRQVPMPTPGIGQVLIKMQASGICGSDIHYIYHGHKGTATNPAPLYQGVINGHEPCGQVVALGAGCKHFKEGNRVIVYHISGCGFCNNCRRGYQISCTGEKQAYGWQRDGGHAEFLLAEERDLIQLPDALSYEDGAFISCGVGTAYEGVLRADISGADSVLIVGLGPVGLAAAMIARGRGARPIIGVDHDAARRQVALDLGLVDAVYGNDAQTLEQIIAQTAGGATATLDCSGHPLGRLLAVQATATWGRTVLLGETGQIALNVSADLLHRQRRLLGSWVTSLANMEDCCGHLVRWKLHPDSLITHRFHLEEADKAYAQMAAGGCGKVVIRFAN